jgi:hypothetical protein
MTAPQPNASRQEIIRSGSHAVAIFTNDPATGPFTACYYVNVPSGPIDLRLADITNVQRKFRSIAGARKWAAKELGAPRA